MSKEGHRELFEKFCRTKYFDHTTTSKTVSEEKAKKIIDVLNGIERLSDVSNSFKFCVIKTKKFALLNYPELKLENVLCLPAKQRNDNDKTVFGHHRIVATAEKFYDILERVHSTENGHVGYKKTLAEVQRMYEGLPREAAQYFCSTCHICQLKQPQNCTAPLKPIISSGFLTRCQIDLIDMRHMPDDSYCYIAHYMGHWSKFHVLWPLINKSAVEVASGLVHKVFPYFGLPKILQSDNGREFVNKVIREILKSWPGEVTMINGRPCHSQSQGLIEKGNHLVEMQLQAFKCEHKDSNFVPWTDWLPRIQYNLNVQVCHTLKQSPYEVVFGQPPRLTPFAELPEGVDHCIMEEDLTNLIKDHDVSLPFDELPPTVFPPTSSSRMSPQQLSRSTSPPSK